jgi:alpha-L-fucosidase 2
MLLQSHDPYAAPDSLTPAQAGDAVFLNLLPALPSAFPAGSVTGLRARGGVLASLAWKDGKLTGATLKASDSKPIKVRYAGREAEIRAEAGRSYAVSPDLKITAVARPLR